MGAVFLGLGSFGFLASTAIAVLGMTTRVWSAVVLALPWIGFFGYGTIVGIEWLRERHRPIESA